MFYFINSDVNDFIDSGHVLDARKSEFKKLQSRLIASLWLLRTNKYVWKLAWKIRVLYRPTKLSYRKRISSIVYDIGCVYFELGNLLFLELAKCCFVINHCRP